MNTQETRICSIPFTGFYDSTHSAAIEWALGSLFSDDSGDTIAPLYDKAFDAFDAFDWQSAHLAYARLYSAALADNCKADWRFARLDSPHFYNYRSDEIDVELTLAELQRIYLEVTAEHWGAFLDLVTGRLSPRSGFIPYYSTDVAEWGALEEWDAPQLSLMIECYCNAYCDAEERACWLIDDSNGELSRICEDAMGEQAEAIFAELNEVLA